MSRDSSRFPTQGQRRQSRAFNAVVDPAAGASAIWGSLFRNPDPLQVDAGAAGELRVARVRLLFANLLLLIPILRLFGGQRTEAWLGLAVVLALVTVSLGLFMLVTRGFYRPWLGFATSGLDASIVSAGLAVWLFLGEPHAAVNNRVIFDAYFLVIAATSLRSDPRICVVTGLLAASQYAAIVLVAANRWDLNGAAFSPYVYGTFEWQDQAARVIMLLAASAISASLVLRSQYLRLLSRSDRLTGLPNRGYFDERVTIELARARRFGHPLSIAMLDIDHFKRFNDTMGHAAGDIALRAVATTLRRMVRERDLLVRYGGEEFLVVFPYLDAAGAENRMDLIRQAIADIPLIVPGRPDAPGMTISVGIASYGESDGTEVEDLLDRADARLYHAKDLGRNRVVGPNSMTTGEQRVRPSA